jgi:chromosome partitioning protein
MKKLRILALSSQKGGAGKTTVAMQLAAGLALAGERVLVADLDPQESALRWAAGSGPQTPFPARVIAAGGSLEAIVGQLAQASKGITVAILDCPPSIQHPHTLAALALARLVVIPVVPSPTDLWSTRAVEQLVLRRIAERPRLRGVLLPNRVQRTALALDVLEVMRDFTLPVLDAALSQRNAYALSAISGGSVFSLGRAAEAAQEEVRRLVAAILDQLGESK